MRAFPEIGQTNKLGGIFFAKIQYRYFLFLVSGRHCVMAPMSTSGSGCLLGYKFMDLGSCSGKCANTFYFHRIFYYLFCNCLFIF